MKLLKARINSFKSVLSTTLNVDPAATVLVGPNEGGKTNVLRALECFNVDNRFSEAHVCQFSAAYDDGQSPEIQLLFGGFSEEERTAFVEAWCAAHQTSSDTGQNPEELANASGASASEGGDSEADNLQQEDRPGSGEIEVPAFLKSFNLLSVARQGNDLSDYTFHLGDVELSLPNETAQRAFANSVLQLMPKFMYFEDVNLLHGEIGIEALLSKSPSFKTERDLFALGGISDLGILAGPPNRRDVAVQKAQQRVTERLRRYWTQDPSREFHIAVDKDVIRIHVSDSTGAFDFPEDRSLGSRWFISFYISFASRVEGEAEGDILLFDEPGIHVHPRGQRDILPFLEEVASKHQVLYTTHLPFLINRNFPSRIRVIDKMADQGTIVNNKPHSNRWKAIRSAVGLLAADSFLVGDSCLIVEGVSDHIYLAGLSRFMAELGQSYIDLNETAVIPASSASETVGPARFCQAEKIPVIILLDSDNQGNQAVSALLKDGFIRPEQIVRVGEAAKRLGPKTYAMEDILPPDIFLDALNAAYVDIVNGFSPLTSSDIGSAQKQAEGGLIPVMNAAQKVFAEKKYGDVDKRLVAERFINDLPCPVDLSDGERARLAKKFSEVKRLLEVISARLRLVAREVEL